MLSPRPQMDYQGRTRAVAQGPGVISTGGSRRRGTTRGVLLPWLLVLVLLWLACPGRGEPTDTPHTVVDLEVFTREGCPRCAAAERFLTELQRAQPALRIVVHDVAKDVAALARLQELATALGVPAVGVPAFYLRGQLLVGYLSADTTGARLIALLASPALWPEETAPAGACLPEASTSCPPESAALTTDSETIDTRYFGRLSVRTLGLPVFTVVLGLLDGFNPCAMWVLLFLLSLLVHLRDRVKMVVIGGTFVVVSGLVYFTFMAAWLNIFVLVGISRMTQVVLGGIALVVGAINIKDFFAFGRGISLSIPAVAKPGIYARVRRILSADNLAGALAGVVVLAVLVNTVELLCTAGFPAVYTRVLTLRQLSWWAYYGYLGLYNMAYMLDDSLMLLIAVVTLGRRQLQEHEGRWLKLVSGTVMLGLGVALMATPEWLAG
jgi:glutaredoxin